MEKVYNRNNILNALPGTSYGQQTEKILITYKAVGRSIIHFAAPAWSTNIRDTNYQKKQYIQSEDLRIPTGCHKMSSIDHLHVEAEILKVMEHSELISAQYLARCLNQIISATPSLQWTPLRDGRRTLFTRHRNSVVPIMLANDRKEILSQEG